MSSAMVFGLVGGAIAALMVVGGLSIVFSRMKAKEQGIDATTIQAIALVLFMPTVLLASVTGLMQGEALAALLGAVAGYVLGRAAPQK